MTLANIIRDCPRLEAHHPWPRILVSEEQWCAIASALRCEGLALSGFWGEAEAVHMAIMDEASGLAVISLNCPNGNFPSVGQFHPPAIRLERAIRDLFGLVPRDSPDTRSWLDHGRWYASDSTPSPYAFIANEGENLHQIAVGPVHAGIIEPGHFRFTANGETVVRLEQRLGYVHKGIEALMAGADIAHGAKLAGRTSGDSTVAYAIAFARAVESAARVEVSTRAHFLRALMAELERLANHFGDVGAICNDASFALIHAHCGILRERVLRAADSSFGHRLMRDCVVPGGVAVDLKADSAAILRALVDEARAKFPALVKLYDDTASLQDRTVTTGILTPALASQFGVGGYVGRASGRAFDARRAFPYSPYESLRFDVPMREDGDVNARLWIRIREVEQSLSLIEQILAQLPDGATHIDVPARAGGEGMAVVEGFRGDILVWLRLNDEGRIARCHLRDPSWFQWPLLETAIEGNIVADFPLINKSFNCSYSGHDL